MYTSYITVRLAILFSYFYFALFSKIIHNCLCRGGSAAIGKRVSFVKYISHSSFQRANGLSSLFHLLYFSVLVYTSSLNVCSPVFILTLRSTSIVLAGSTQFNWCSTKSQVTFISFAILK